MNLILDFRWTAWSLLVGQLIFSSSVMCKLVYLSYKKKTTLAGKIETILTNVCYVAKSWYIVVFFLVPLWVKPYPPHLWPAFLVVIVIFLIGDVGLWLRLRGDNL